MCVDCKKYSGLYCLIPLYYHFYLFPSICFLSAGFHTMKRHALYAVLQDLRVFIDTRSLCFKYGIRIQLTIITTVGNRLYETRECCFTNLI